MPHFTDWCVKCRETLRRRGTPDGKDPDEKAMTLEEIDAALDDFTDELIAVAANGK